MIWPVDLQIFLISLYKSLLQKTESSIFCLEQYLGAFLLTSADKVRQGKEYHPHEPGTLLLKTDPAPAHSAASHRNHVQPARKSRHQPEVHCSNQSTSLCLLFCKEGQLEAFESSQIMMHLVAPGCRLSYYQPSQCLSLQTAAATLPSTADKL